MIIQIRVDDRLIHGQVALVWSKELNTSGIVVANDKASTNEVLSATLQMAVPTGQKLLIKSVKDAIPVFNNPKAKEMRIFALTNSIKDAWELVKNCPGMIKSVNVANIGRFDNTPDHLKVQLNGTIMLNPEELQAAKELVNQTEVEVYHQLIPSNSKVPIKKLISNKN